MLNIKTNYDTIKEIQFRGSKNGSKPHKFGIAISQYRCIICGEKRKDVNEEGICLDCLKLFPVKEDEKRVPNQNLSIERGKSMSTKNDFLSVLKQSISILDEQLTKIIVAVSNATKEKQFDEISKLSSDAKYIKDVQSLLQKMSEEYEDRFEDSPTSLKELIKKAKINEEIVIDPNKPPSLSFTNIIDAKIENETAKNWSSLVRMALKIGVRKGLDIFTLQKITSIKLRRGSYNEDGYKFEPTVGFSYQELSAQKSWENVFKIVKHLKIPIRIVLKWQQKEGIKYPGKKGIIQWRP